MKCHIAFFCKNLRQRRGNCQKNKNQLPPTGIKKDADGQKSLQIATVATNIHESDGLGDGRTERDTN